MNITSQFQTNLATNDSFDDHNLLLTFLLSTVSLRARVRVELHCAKDPGAGLHFSSPSSFASPIEAGRFACWRRFVWRPWKTKIFWVICANFKGIPPSLLLNSPAWSFGVDCLGSFGSSSSDSRSTRASVKEESIKSNESRVKPNESTAYLFTFSTHLLLWLWLHWSLLQPLVHLVPAGLGPPATPGWKHKIEI